MYPNSSEVKEGGSVEIEKMANITGEVLAGRDENCEHDGGVEEPSAGHSGWRGAIAPSALCRPIYGFATVSHVVWDELRVWLANRGHRGPGN